MSELRFHDIHGANISLSPNGHIAQRLSGYANGLVFTSRPIRSLEKVLIKFVKLSPRTSSTICFGFTSKNPSRLFSEDLQNSYHELLTSTGCYWIWPLFKHMCNEDTTLFYYFDDGGAVHFGIDDQEIDSFYKRVSVRGPLWAILDVDGDSTTVEIVPGDAVYSHDMGEELDEELDRGKNYINEEALCTVCCQKEINAVLYKCGHMCMCFQCAVQQKHGVGNGHCPICRAVIKDVIRTFR